MKKRLLYICFVLMFMAGIIGCDENGDDGYYDNQYRIYFQNDSVYFPLGDKSVTVTTYEIKVPVKILGQPAREGMKFRVKTNETLTTAPSNFYTEIPQEIKIQKDSVNTYVPLKLLRSNIPSEKNVLYRLVLELEENEDFQLGIEEKLRTVVLFDNYLAEPEWWRGLENNYIGKYHPMKYQKIIEVWGGPVSSNDFSFKTLKLLKACKKMYKFFQLHPEYGMTFPEKIAPWPYE